MVPSPLRDKQRGPLPWPCLLVSPFPAGLRCFFPHREWNKRLGFSRGARYSRASVSSSRLPVFPALPDLTPLAPDQPPHPRPIPVLLTPLPTLLWKADRSECKSRAELGGTACFRGQTRPERGREKPASHSIPAARLPLGPQPLGRGLSHQQELWQSPRTPAPPPAQSRQPGPPTNRALDPLHSAVCEATSLTAAATVPCDHLRRTIEAAVTAVTEPSRPLGLGGLHPSRSRLHRAGHTHVQEKVLQALAKSPQVMCLHVDFQGEGQTRRREVPRRAKPVSTRPVTVLALEPVPEPCVLSEARRHPEANPHSY